MNNNEEEEEEEEDEDDVVAVENRDFLHRSCCSSLEDVEMTKDINTNASTKPTLSLPIF